MTIRDRLGILAVTLALLAAPLLTAPASADDTDPGPPPSPVPGDTVVTAETFTTKGKLVSARTYGAETEGQLMDASAGTEVDGGGITPMGSGDGGTSSASGCRRVTVRNETESTLGFTTYWFNTWTRWCWNRSTQVVYDVTHGWFLEDVDVVAEWQGIVKKELLFYDYSTNDGHPRSAFKHYRMGKFKLCVPSIGCYATLYPANLLRSYYNGTWVWQTWD